MGFTLAVKNMLDWPSGVYTYKVYEHRPTGLRCEHFQLVGLLNEIPEVFVVQLAHFPPNPAGPIWLRAWANRGSI